MAGMSEALARRSERRVRQRAANRGAILAAARRLAEREGAADLSLRGVAAEAGYAPASVYAYFRNRAELVLALAADDLGGLARAVRGMPNLAAAAHAALGLIRRNGALAAAAATLESGEAPPEAERLFNGRLIAALTALGDAAGRAPLRSADDQTDIVLIAAAVAGLAMLARSGRLKALGLDEQELLERLDRRFAPKL
jgi:AcrR family transcriptional regulator